MSERRRPPNPLSLPRPRRRVHTREIVFDEDVYLFSLVRPDILDTTAALARSEELIKFFITGDAERGIPPSEFPIASEEPFEITTGLCQNAALMARLLRPVGDDGQDCIIYNAEEMMALALTRKSVYDALLSFLNELPALEAEEKKTSVLTLPISISEP
jgi:hypothetical protein